MRLMSIFSSNNAKINLKELFTRLMLLSFLLSIILTAATPATKVLAAAKHKGRLDDTANLLNDDEYNTLSNKLNSYADSASMDIVILTVNDLEGKYPSRFIEDYVDFNCDRGIFSEDVTVLLVAMKSRDVRIEGYGEAEKYVNDDRIDAILDDITSMLTSKNYYDAFLTYMKQVDYYAARNPDIPEILFNLWFQLLIALVIGGITIGIMVGRSGAKITTNNRTYLDNDHSGVVARRDIYLRTSVTRIRKPDPPKSGGGFSGGRGGISSGGRSHSGGGRKF